MCIISIYIIFFFKLLLFLLSNFMIINYFQKSFPLLFTTINNVCVRILKISHMNSGTNSIGISFIISKPNFSKTSRGFFFRICSFNRILSRFGFKEFFHILYVHIQIIYYTILIQLLIGFFMNIPSFDS